MSHFLKLNPVEDILDSISDAIDEAEKMYWRGGDAAVVIRVAFMRLRFLLEAVSLPEALKDVQQVETVAAKDYTEVEEDEIEHQEYLVWVPRLRQYVRALRIMFGNVEKTTVTKDVIQILRETQYSITDPHCFPCPPRDEREVHIRIEGVLRCVFSDLINKPRINKQIKHFEPDTGLPGINTLIEYKFIGSQADAKRVADEVLADTRGYASKDWTQLIYVIYETKRIRPEKQWNQLLRTCDVPENTSIIVIHGEEPTRAKGRFSARKGVAVSLQE
jgi:hypothetical protein